MLYVPIEALRSLPSVVLICVCVVVFSVIFIGCHVAEDAAETERITHPVNKNDAETEIEDKSLSIQPQRPGWRMRQTDLEKSVKQCLDDFSAIRPGMTRREVEEKFPMDGGMHTLSLIRFVHPDRYYFKVDFSFSYESNPNDQNRAVWRGAGKVMSVSAPYIENPYYD